MMEKWIPIVGYEGLYEVSNKGNVKSNDRKVRYLHAVNRKEYFRKKKGKLLKLTTNKKSGYIYITLHKNGEKVKTLSIHRLVALHFVKKNHQYDCVNHIDFNKANNKASNLEWCNHKQNSKHAKENNLYIKGEDHYKSFLSNAQVAEARKSKKSITELSKYYNVEYRSMWQIIRGITRK